MYYAELEKNCDEEIYKVIDKHEKEGILIDNFWLASGYSSGEKGQPALCVQLELQALPGAGKVL